MAEHHRCPALFCTIWVPMHWLACINHWESLPQDIRDGLTATRYRRGQRRAHLAFYTQAVRLLTGGAIEGAPG
jgi:hypothetical protein